MSSCWTIVSLPHNNTINFATLLSHKLIRLKHHVMSGSILKRNMKILVSMAEHVTWQNQNMTKMVLHRNHRLK